MMIIMLIDVNNTTGFDGVKQIEERDRERYRRRSSSCCLLTVSRVFKNDSSGFSIAS